MRLRHCKSCGEGKPLTEFYRKGKNGYRTSCKPCYKLETVGRRQRPEVKQRLAEQARQWRREHPRQWLENSLKHRFGIGAAEYEGLFEDQDGRCAICLRQTAQRLAVDHEHDSGRIRGLLCKTCNLLLGLAHESIETLRAAIVYLETR